MKRFLNCRTSDFRQKPTAEALKNSIVQSEGRVIMAEFDAETSPYYPEVTNAELLAAFGADMILIKSMNCQTQDIAGSHPSFGKDGVDQVKNLVGLPVGVSMQVVPQEQLSAPNAFTVENLKAVQHADFICLTAYDKPGITSELLLDAIKEAREHFDGFIIAAKYFSTGVNEPEIYASFAQAGADAILVPAPSSVRRSSEARVEAAIEAIHDSGALAVTTISSSQEGSDNETVRQIGLAAKRCGSDVANFGDAGISGIPAPEALQTLSIAIRGRRHTYVRMASSILR